jgi:hypothetical protein
MRMAKTATKTYKIEGKVLEVYEPRQVDCKFGSKVVTKDVTDLLLQTKSGSKVKLCFWETDCSEYEGATILVTKIVYKGEYKGTAQYSSTKDSEVQILKAGTAKPAQDDAAEPEGIEPDTDSEPEVGEPEQEAVAETTEGVPEAPPPPKAKKATAKKVAPTATSGISDAVKTAVTDVYTVAFEIATAVAPKTVKDEARAFQALAVGIAIELAKKDYFDKK